MVRRRSAPDETLEKFGFFSQFRLYLVAVIVRDGCDAALFRKLNVKLEKPRGIKNFIEQ